LKYPLRTISKHFFLEKDGKLWLLDTGAPQSFGCEAKLELAGLTFDIQGNYMELTPAQLSEFVSVDCTGLLGADVLGKFWHPAGSGRRIHPGFYRISSDRRLFGLKSTSH